MNTIAISIVSLIIAIISLASTIYRWTVDWKRQRENDRLDFLQKLFHGFSNHNWKFIEYWDFPGVYPQNEELQDTVSPAKSPAHKIIFGKRIVALEHLNILLQIFSHREILSPEDIRGFATWAQSWLNGLSEALKVILNRGDLYPLDFIFWLDNVIFPDKNFASLIGPTLRGRMDEYQTNKKNKK